MCFSLYPFSPQNRKRSQRRKTCEYPLLIWPVGSRFCFLHRRTSVYWLCTQYEKLVPPPRFDALRSSISSVLTPSFQKHPIFLSSPLFCCLTNTLLLCTGELIFVLYGRCSLSITAYDSCALLLTHSSSSVLNTLSKWQTAFSTGLSLHEFQFKVWCHCCILRPLLFGHLLH